MTPPVLPDRYALGPSLGRGGMGEVWRVTDRVLRRTVALKVLHDASPGATEQFRAETRVVAQLQHPGHRPGPGHR